MNDKHSTTDDLSWIVLLNREGQYALWPACMPVPEGWRETGPEGDADHCAAWVDRQGPRPPAAAANA